MLEGHVFVPWLFQVLDWEVLLLPCLEIFTKAISLSCTMIILPPYTMWSFSQQKPEEWRCIIFVSEGKSYQSHFLTPGFRIISQFKETDHSSGSHWSLVLFPVRSAGLGSSQGEFPGCGLLVLVGKISCAPSLITADETSLCWRPLCFLQTHWT